MKGLHSWSLNHTFYSGTVGFPRLLSGKESACQRRRHKRRRFNPWIREIPWRRAW